MEGGEGFNPNSVNVEKKVVDWTRRESDKKQELQKKYNDLTQEQKDAFVGEQQRAVGFFAQLVNSNQEISDLLPEEKELLGKTRKFINEQKKLRPGQLINVAGFSQEEDKAIYENLIGRWAISEVIEENNERIPLTKEEIHAMKQVAFKRDEDGMPVERNWDLMLQRIDPDLGKRFDAHGINKVNYAYQLDALINLLNNGVDENRPFHTANLELPEEDKVGGVNSAGGTAYKDGSFVVLSDPDKLISESGIKNVIVNDAYYEILDKLKAAYPDIKFIRADNVNHGLQEIISKKSAEVLLVDD